MGQKFDVAVVGGGLAGASVALAAANSGFRTVLIGPKSSGSDARTTALMLPSIALLQDIEVWPHVIDVAAPLRHMRIIDGTARILRAPTVTFHAGELDLDAFGYNIPNAPLLETLFNAIDSSPALVHLNQTVADIKEDAEQVDLLMADGSTVSASLVVGADGRNSIVRSAAGIAARDWNYPQTAIVLNFSHEIGHDDTSNEFHTEHGPFTQVPLPGRRSSLVWAMAPADAEAALDMTAEALSRKVEDQMQSILGKVQIESTIQSFPFKGMIARSFGNGRMALVGEAGHAFPPIGAQGLNLGLRDVADLVKALRDAGGPANALEAVRSYDRARQSDVLSRTASVDLLNRSLLNGFLPVQLARSAGLAALSGFAPLRNFAMREGMKPGSGVEGLRRIYRRP